ncbi:endolytic transglycosylase MltG [Nocardioides sp.]|uniref:endolytic transglycosylase MltG n=1 Tax=Nocardioides sp. TaxID=35761 RepID=UPI001A28DA6C|nr:endolytic transglycosylase MltG [Nocardioides sp.]MBJ7358260.1 endolytic transglycosylase MltG [Nocardioides sp.]
MTDYDTGPTTDTGSFLAETTGTPAGGRRAERSRRRGPGCLIALVVLALLFGGLYLGVTKGVDYVRDQFEGTPDYPGPGTGEVVFEVKSGDSVAEMGRGLKELDVVKSVDAFTEAASANPDSTRIQVGFYTMRLQMKAEDAVNLLVDPANAVNAAVTIPEGLRVVDIVERLVEETDFTKKQFNAALADTAALGLPAYAEGNPEGYLFPATYEFGPEAQPADMLRAMVARWEQAAADVDLVAKAEALGYTPHEMMTIASLVEAEGRGDYTPKIARVIYNRLEIDPNPANGLLQIDATVNYALGRPGIVVLTEDEIDSVADSPYNTYEQPGLPPGPIEAPGQAAMEAALNPDEGPWFFYVTVNLETGETKFTEDYDEFLEFKNEFREYCETQSDRC